MPCLCTSNTLRLFIRNVAQVDVHATSNLFASQSSTRNLTKPAIHNQYRFSSKAYSSASVPLGEPSSNAPETDRVRSASNGHAESAFAEFSPDVIDAIAAESKSQSPLHELGQPTQTTYNPTRPSREIRPRRDRPARHSTPSRRDQPRRDDVKGTTTFRFTKNENSSFQLHLSAPRKPRLDKEELAARSKSNRREPSASNYKFSRDTTKKPAEDNWAPPGREHWQIDKDAIKEKFPDGWNPQKRLSPDAISGIRALHSQMPEKYNTKVLAETFEVSPEMIRRILRTKWVPSPEEETDRQRRWFKRGESVWSRYAELGVKPPKKWRDLGIGNGKPEWMKRKMEPERVKPTLITLPRREGGTYRLGGDVRPESLEDTIL